MVRLVCSQQFYVITATGLCSDEFSLYAHLHVDKFVDDPLVWGSHDIDRCVAARQASATQIN